MRFLRASERNSLHSAFYLSEIPYILRQSDGICYSKQADFLLEIVITLLNSNDFEVTFCKNRTDIVF